MATTTFKTLAQIAPGASTNTTAYTVPAATQAVVSTLVVCNRGASTVFRVAVRPAGAALDTKHYIMFDAPVNANDTVFITIGMTLAATDVITVQASSADISFTLFGSEIA